MKRKKIKALLHAQKAHRRAQQATKKENLRADQQLHLNYVAASDRQNTRVLTASFNAVRRKNAKEELNKFKHPFSRHIRLKPYFDAHAWLHWIGLLSDLTLPNIEDNLNGDLLIDKLATAEHHELLDFHVWLNLENVKYIQSKQQKIGIGDIIEGYSQVLCYNKNKYGLGTTVLRRAGIYRGQNSPQVLIGKYDRQDDWVVEIDNSAASERAWQAFRRSHSTIELENAVGHVEVRYQPSRYERYRERLHELKRKKSDDVLPLVPSYLSRYTGQVAEMRAVKSANVSYRIPQLVLKNVRNAAGRLVAARVALPYTQYMKRMGELVPDDQVTFVSKASPEPHYLFGLIDKFNLLTKHAYYPLPEFPNTFLGYLIWRNPHTDYDPSLVINYQNWALARNLHVDEIKEEIAESLPQRDLSEHELAVRFGVTDAVIHTAYAQGMIKADVNKTERRFGLSAWRVLLQLLSAQDPHSVQAVKKDLPVFSEEDLADKFKLSRDEVRDRIKQAGFLPLNGFHYKVNLFGPRVYEMFAQGVILPARTGEKAKFHVEPTVKLLEGHGPRAAIALPAPQIKSRAEKLVKTTAKRRVALLIKTFAGSYFCNQFSSFQEADQFIEKSAASKYTNRFLHVINLATQKQEVISTKAIVSFYQQK